MQLTRSLALVTVAAVLLAACGDDDDTVDRLRPAHRRGRRRPRTSPEAHRVAVADGDRDALRHRRRRPGRGRRRPVRLPRGRADDRPVGRTSRTSRPSPPTSPTSSWRPDLPEDVTAGLEALDIEVLDIAGRGHARRHLRPDRRARRGHRPRGRGRGPGGRDARATSTSWRPPCPTATWRPPTTTSSTTRSTRSPRTRSSARSTAWPGLENVADPADPDGEFGGYPQLSAEFLVEADPDLVFLADTECCGQDADHLRRPARLRRPRGGARTGTSCVLDDDIASPLGPAGRRLPARRSSRPPRRPRPPMTAVAVRSTPPGLRTGRACGPAGSSPASAPCSSPRSPAS